MKQEVTESKMAAMVNQMTGVHEPDVRWFPVDAISHHGKWHSVEMVKSVADGMVAVIIGRVTVEAQMPFS